ncbi:MAG: hypothetical protein ABFE07_28005 [Armatimonadia bacterium]
MVTAFVLQWRNRTDVFSDQLEAELTYPFSNVGAGKLLDITRAPGYDLVITGKMQGTGYGYWVAGSVEWSEAAVAEALAHRENKPAGTTVQKEARHVEEARAVGHS